MPSMTPAGTRATPTRRALRASATGRVAGDVDGGERDASACRAVGGAAAAGKINGSIGVVRRAIPGVGTGGF